MSKQLSSVKREVYDVIEARDISLFISSKFSVADRHRYLERCTNDLGVVHRKLVEEARRAYD